jgi:hypothetical protein
VGLRAGLDGRKISSPLGFDSRTVQPVAQSLYRLSYPAHVVTVLRGIIEFTYLLTIRPMFSAIYRIVVINYE